jgi:hypothetical protein
VLRKPTEETRAQARTTQALRDAIKAMERQDYQVARLLMAEASRHLGEAWEAGIREEEKNPPRR